MPTYQYQCDECGTITEVFHSITASARRRLKKEDDPQCDCGARVTRLIGTGAGIIFKGSGFYETDYRSEAYKKDAKADKDASGTKSKKKEDGKSTESTTGGKSAASGDKKAASTDKSE